ncbi:hypothetical protein [Comamonas sp. NoAH]|uniref:hypothetical protein n=1 Tax=Comamonas halotolerans TaxID=3041496 RepID=UPI0024E19255|nr:hypothetical protein [Comamonas sp. NoAH]
MGMATIMVIADIVPMDTRGRGPVVMDTRDITAAMVVQVAKDIAAECMLRLPPSVW